MLPYTVILGLYNFHAVKETTDAIRQHVTDSLLQSRRKTDKNSDPQESIGLSLIHI